MDIGNVKYVPSVSCYTEKEVLNINEFVFNLEILVVKTNQSRSPLTLKRMYLKKDSKHSQN